jgi:hypothetical protein
MKRSRIPDASPQEVHYRLNLSNLQELCKLKYAELKIFLYLKCKHPFEDRHSQLDMEDLMKTTGIKSLGTIYPALGQLQQLGLVRWTIQKSFVCAFNPTSLPALQNLDQSTDPEISPLILRSMERSQDHSIDPAIAPLKKRKLKIVPHKGSSNAHTNQTDQTKQTDQKLERSELEEDPEYLAWINRKIDRFPQEPAFREQVEAAEAAKPINQRAFLKWQQKREEAKFSAHSQQAPKIENEEIDNSLETQIKRARAKWMANPRARPEIRAWAELEGIPMDESGPCIAIEGGEA